MTATARLNLMKENRGAIMVVGIFFACMMIGWMWFMIGLGDAIIWRDRSQEAADAAAYTSSAIQAQGMNLISFCNIIMFIMAVLYMGLAFIYNILDVLHVIFGSKQDGECGILPSSCDARKDIISVLDKLPYLEWLEPLEGVWQPICKGVAILHDGNSNGAPKTGSIGWMLDKYESAMIFAFPKLSTFEDFVSYASPWAGTALSIYVAHEYSDWNTSRLGIAASGTLMPATLTPGKAGSNFTVKKWTTCDDSADTSAEPNGSSGGDTAAPCKDPSKCYSDTQAGCNPDNGGDKREGLPVGIPDSGFTALCEHAGDTFKTAIQNLLNPLIGGLPGASTVLGWVLGKIAGAFEDAYCHKDSTGLFKVFGVNIDDGMAWGAQIATGCFYTPPWGGQNNNETCPQDNWGQSGGGSGDCGNGGPGTCNAVYQMKLDGHNGSTDFWEDPTKAGGPHLVVDYASNGGDWMQSWGFVWGGNSDIYQGRASAQRLVGVAGMDSSAGGGTWSNNPGDESSGIGGLFNFYLAQSEFYFDCADKWEADECNADNNASYSIGWRARLRRVHGLSWGQDLFGMVWSGLNPQTGMQQRYDQIVSAHLSNPLEAWAAKKLMNLGMTKLYSYLGNVAGSALNPASSIPEFIH